MMRVALFAAPVALMLSTMSLAQGQQDFRLINATGYSIAEVYVAPSKSSEWEEDVMGRDMLGVDEEVDITFDPREDVCHYDLKVRFADGDEAEWYDFNLCQVSWIRLHYNNKTGDTTAEYE